MKTVIKYKAPFFRGPLPCQLLRALRWDGNQATGLDFEVYGRTYILSGPGAPEAALALVKAFGGSFETIQ